MDGAHASASRSHREGAAPDLALQMVSSVALTMLCEVLGSSLTGKLLAGALGALLGAFLTARGTRHGRRIVAVALLLMLLDALKATAARASTGGRPSAGEESGRPPAWMPRQPALVLAVGAAGFAIGTGAMAAAQGLASAGRPSHTLAKHPKHQVLRKTRTPRLNGNGINGSRATGSTVSPQTPRERPPSSHVTVPELAGLKASEATAKLDSIGLSPKTTTEPSETRPGLVIGTNPAAGTTVAKGSTVTLNISIGPTKPAGVTIPDLAGHSADEAITTLERIGLSPKSNTEHSEIPSNKVIGTNPAAGTIVEKGSTVTLNISAGPLEGQHSVTPE